MSEVNITINGRIYEIGCDAGQEGRVVDLAAHIDQRLQSIARTGAAYNDTHLMVLTALVLADEIFEARESASRGKSAKTAKIDKTAKGPEASAADEAALANVLEHLAERIDGIAARVQAA